MINRFYLSTASKPALQTAIHHGPLGRPSLAGEIGEDISSDSGAALRKCHLGSHILQEQPSFLDHTPTRDLQTTARANKLQLRNVMARHVIGRQRLSVDDSGASFFAS